MKRFSKIVSINEGDNTYEMGKGIDYKPDNYDDILEMLKTFKESYSDVEQVDIFTGYTTKKNLQFARSVNSLQVLGRKKILNMFKDGRVPDKWQFIMTVAIKYISLEGDQLHDKSVLDMVVKRYNAVKTLISRCENYGIVDTKITLGSSISGEISRFSILLVFE